jgi:hypothetical protein
MYGEFIIIKLGRLIYDRTDQTKNTPPKEFFLLSRGCGSGEGEGVS